jgi:hypothetical protein
MGGWYATLELVSLPVLSRPPPTLPHPVPLTQKRSMPSFITDGLGDDPDVVLAELLAGECFCPYVCRIIH